MTPAPTPLSVPTNLSVLFALTVIEPVEPLSTLGRSVVIGLALEAATLITTEPLSVTKPVPSEPTPVAFPTCSVVPV